MTHSGISVSQQPAASGIRHLKTHSEWLNYLSLILKVHVLRVTLFMPMYNTCLHDADKPEVLGSIPGGRMGVFSSSKLSDIDGVIPYVVL